MNKLHNHELQIAAALALMRLNIVPGLSLAYIAAHFDEQERKLAHECENNSILLAECRRAQDGYAAMIAERDEANRKLALCRDAMIEALDYCEQTDDGASGLMERLRNAIEATKP